MTLNKKSVLYANKWIVDKGLVELTWGNVSCYDRQKSTIYIKPSGVSLDSIKEDDISSLTIKGSLLSGKKPSVDTPTHLEIYRNFSNVNCVIHTHSKYATIFAQANMSIPCLGTTHSDYFYGPIPCVEHPNMQEVNSDYEKQTGIGICNYFESNKINPLQMGSCLVKGHGVFSWGPNIEKALEKAYVLELIAEMAYKTIIINPDAKLERFILDKHFLRKHGENKYYGQ
jgi:L-ribulose-5-phosphate 4-epimerase